MFESSDTVVVNMDGIAAGMICLYMIYYTEARMALGQPKSSDREHFMSHLFRRREVIQDVGRDAEVLTSSIIKSS